jgi:type IV pilus assembly protein PilM
VRFLLAGDVRQGTEIKQEIIALGAARAVVEARIEQLTDLGLNPVAIDAPSCAVFRGFERFLRRDEDVNEINVFVDMGYSATRVLVSRGPELIFYKSIPIGGKRFDELAAEQLELSVDEAAQVRIRLLRQHVAEISGQGGQIPEDDAVGESIQQTVINAMRPALEQLSKEIGLCLRYCSVTFRGMRSEAVTVVGGDACNRDILRVLSDQVNVPFHVGKAMRSTGADADFGGSERRTGQPEWATAAGLALKPALSLLTLETSSAG